MDSHRWGGVYLRLWEREARSFQFMVQLWRVPVHRCYRPLLSVGGSEMHIVHESFPYVQLLNHYWTFYILMSLDVLYQDRERIQTKKFIIFLWLTSDTLCTHRIWYKLIRYRKTLQNSNRYNFLFIFFESAYIPPTSIIKKIYFHESTAFPMRKVRIHEGNTIIYLSHRYDHKAAHQSMEWMMWLLFWVIPRV